MLLPRRPLPDGDQAYYEVDTWYRRLDQAADTVDRCVRIRTSYFSVISLKTWMVIAAQERCSLEEVRFRVDLTEQRVYKVSRRLESVQKPSSRRKKNVASRKHLDSRTATMVK